MKPGVVYIIQMTWWFVVAAEIQSIDNVTGEILCSHVATVRSWTTEAGMESVVLGPPWQENVKLEIIPGRPAARGGINRYSMITWQECADQEGWKRRLRGEPS